MQPDIDGILLTKNQKYKQKQRNFTSPNTIKRKTSIPKVVIVNTQPTPTMFIAYS